MIYAQLNEDSVCVGISTLAGEVPEMNYLETDEYDPLTNKYTTKTEFIGRMIPIPVMTEKFLGLRYTEEGKWEEVPETEPIVLVVEEEDIVVPQDILDAEGE